MKGTKKIVIRNNRVVFTLELERNITVICGDSGTGKTTLTRLVENYETYGSSSGVAIQSDVPCHVLSGVDWELRLSHIENSIVFVDEGMEFLHTVDFARAIRCTSNYYVLITRESLTQLPYSVDAILELKKTSSRYHHTYNRTYPYYKKLNHAEAKLNLIDSIVTEDSNSGYQFFSVLAQKKGVACKSANGKSNILSKLQTAVNGKVLVVADGAAFGAEIDKVYRYKMLMGDNMSLYLPESFEWLILSSGIVPGHEISELLEHPADHIDSAELFSWGQFFTAYLERATEGTVLAYRKNRLADAYLRPENLSRIVRAMEGNT